MWIAVVGREGGMLTGCRFSWRPVSPGDLVMLEGADGMTMELLARETKGEECPDEEFLLRRWIDDEDKRW